jgi:hypothetical protein
VRLTAHTCGLGRRWDAAAYAKGYHLDFGFSFLAAANWSGLSHAYDPSGALSIREEEQHIFAAADLTCPGRRFRKP